MTLLSLERNVMPQLAPFNPVIPAELMPPTIDEVTNAMTNRIMTSLGRVTTNETMESTRIVGYDYVKPRKLSRLLQDEDDPVVRAERLRGNASLKRIALSAIVHGGDFGTMQRLHGQTGLDDVIRDFPITPSYDSSAQRWDKVWGYGMNYGTSYALRWFGSGMQRIPLLHVTMPIFEAVEHGVQLRAGRLTRTRIAERFLSLSFQSYYALDPKVARKVSGGQNTDIVIPPQQTPKVTTYIANANARMVSPIATGLIAQQNFA